MKNFKADSLYLPAFFATIANHMWSALPNDKKN